MENDIFLPFFIYKQGKHTLYGCRRDLEAATYYVDLGNIQYFVGISRVWMEKNKDELRHVTFNHELDEVLKQ